MPITNFLHKVFLRLAILPLVGLLYTIGWKKSVLAGNLAQTRLSPGPLFRARLYSHALLDLARLFFGRYESPLQIRAADAPKLKKLKSSSSLFLTAHFHNWELMGSWLTRQGVPLLSAARPLARPWAQSLIDTLRLRLSMNVIYRDIPRGALRHLAAGGCFALLWDQRVSRSDTAAPLFGIPVRLDPLPGFLLRHLDVPVIFGAFMPGGRIRLLELHRPRNPTPSSTDKVARRYHRVLETLVRKHPSYWYGLAHRRFLDAIPAVPGPGVSRETLVPPGLMVSRETKLPA